MLDWILLILSVLLIIIGIIGCVLPILPGPPISFGGILLLQFTRFGNFTLEFLFIMGFLAFAVTILDYIVPAWGTKKQGGSKYGIRGATVGLIIGIFFFPPVGMIIGTFLGALIGEIIYGNDKEKAFKAALGSLMGFILGVGMKLFVSFLITFYFIKEFF